MNKTFFKILQYSLIGAICMTPFFSKAADTSYDTMFTLTSYYSAEQGQVAFARGGYTAELILQGKGTHGASGEEVFAGMIAAPGSYEFGTVIELEGLGVFKISDRGGAIVEAGVLDLAKHDRLDIWMGHGEAGLARALDFGVQHLSATVYPKGTPHPPISFDLEEQPAPLGRLRPYESEHHLDMRAQFEDYGLTVQYVQEHLLELGYFHGTPTGYFGPVTKRALQIFINEMGLDESSEEVSATTIAYLLAAIATEKQTILDDYIYSDNTNVHLISTAQRTLRGLGYYRGRTHGVYDANFANAVIRLQQQYKLVADSSSLGAGNIGPKTLAALNDAHYKMRVRQTANTNIDMQRVNDSIKQSDIYVGQFLESGWQGKEVEKLQRLLKKLGYFTADINGVFGPATKAGVIAFQLDEGIIESAQERYAGYIGTDTLKALRTKARLGAFSAMRSFGVSVL
jgi:peptidoglycan hydrolase-like protein with peptidoglycan-binding domain